MPSTSVLSTYTAFAASAMLVRYVLNEVQAMTKQLISQQLHDKILSKMGGLRETFHPKGFSSLMRPMGTPSMKCSRRLRSICA
ncbi:hypothetical protein CsSME_00021654 [Camellia sinensis var. sinensis]